MPKVYLILIWTVLSASIGYGRFLDSLSVAPVYINNETSEHKAYMLELTRWAYADLFYRVDDGPLQHKRTGGFLPLNERDYPSTKSSFIRVELGPGQVLSGEIRRLQIPYVGPPPYDESLSIISEDDAIARIWNHMALSIITCACLFFIFVYNLIFFTVTRNRLYRYYLPSVIFMVLESLRETGLLLHIFPDWGFYAEHERYLGSILTTSFVIFSAFFLRDLIELPKRFPLVNRLFYGYIATTLVVSVMTWIDYRIAIDFTIFCLPVFMMVQLYVAGLNLLQKHRYSLQIFIVVCILIVATLIHLLGLSGWFDSNGDFFASMRSLGMILVDTIMAFILGRIVWDLRKQNAFQKEQIIHNLQKEQKAQLEIAMAVTDIQEKERHDFAIDLQDDLQNQLITIRYALLGLQATPPKSKLELFKRQDQLNDLINESIIHVEQLAFDLMPEGLEDADSFFQAVDAQLNQFEKIGVKFPREFEGEEKLPLQVRALAFRVVRELVLNALNHAGADEIQVKISHLKQLLRITIEDNGLGMEATIDPKKGGGLGKIMANVLLYGGELSMVPLSEGGTRFSVVIKTRIEKRPTPFESLN